MNGALQVLDQHQVTVVGLQEFQTDQRAAFQSRAQGWADVPRPDRWAAAPARTPSPGDTDVWELVKPATVPIPYFSGNIRPDALRSCCATSRPGVQAYFSNFHNPADIRQFQHQQRFRTEAATAREIELFNDARRRPACRSSSPAT